MTYDRQITKKESRVKTYRLQPVSHVPLCLDSSDNIISSNEMGEEASQVRTRLNPVLVEDSGHALILVYVRTQKRTVDTPRSWSGEDTPRSHVRREQWTHLDPGQERIHLDPMLGEDSGHLNPGWRG